MRRSLLRCAVASVFFLSLVSAAAEEANEIQVERPAGPSGGAMTIDLLVVRPLSFAALVIGTAISLVATPFPLVSGTTSPVYEKLVIEPYTFAI